MSTDLVRELKSTLSRLDAERDVLKHRITMAEKQALRGCAHDWQSIQHPVRRLAGFFCHRCGARK
jgi:hypothetical protein